MKRTFIVVALIVGSVWAGTEIWLSGYQQGYVEGEDSAWSRANRKYPEPFLGEMSSRPKSRLGTAEKLLVDNNDK